MKISARNQLAGVIFAIHKGTTTSHIVLEIEGAKIFSSITNEAVAELGLKEGQKAKAIIKASDVMIGID